MADLYAIVGSMERARVMLEAQVPVLQLRFKEISLEENREEIASWPSKYPTTKLIINDDLFFAVSVGAYGVHLGQEDLARYTNKTLRTTSINLGISTHSTEEIEMALRYNPVMIGFGPIFPTQTKFVGHRPQGEYRLAEIVAETPLPVIAIGGIDETNLDRVIGSNVAMVAMISHLDKYPTPSDVKVLIQRLRRPLDPSS